MKEVITSETYENLHRKITEFMENHDVAEWVNVTIVTEKAGDEDGYWWAATIVPEDTERVLKGLLIEEHGYVDVFWNEEDIQDRADCLFTEDEIPTSQLTPEQMKDIKDDLSSTHDAEQGLTWESVDCAIRNVFDADSDPDEACERDRELFGDDEEDESDEFRHVIENLTPEQ